MDCESTMGDQRFPASDRPPLADRREEFRPESFRHEAAIPPHID